MIEIYGDYYLEFIFLSVLVMIIATYFMMDVVLRSKRAVQKTWGNLWLLLGPLIFSIGIWSIHFIGMLAFSLPDSFHYNWMLSILSFIIIDCASVIAFYVCYQRKGAVISPLVSSIIMSIGISAMHVIGMKSLKFQGTMEVPLSFLILSSLLALLLSGIVFFGLFGRESHLYLVKKYKLIVAIFIGMGMSFIHYLVISGTRFFVPRDLVNYLPQSSHDSFITHGVTISVMSLLFIILFLAYFDKYKALQTNIVKDREYMALYFNSPNLLCTITNEGMIYNANNPFIMKVGVLPGGNVMLPTLFLNPDTIQEKIQETLQGKQVHYKDQMISTNNERLQVEVTHIPIKFKEKVTGITVAIKDITEIEEVKQQAAEKSYLNETILTTMSEGLLVYDNDGIAMRTNTRAAELLRVSYEDSYKVNPFYTELTFVDEEENKLSRSDWPAIRVLKEHITFKDYVLGMVRADDEIQWLSLNASPLIVKGNVVGALLTFTDVTEIRAQALDLIKTNQQLEVSMKEAMQANQVKSEFLSRMSHELKTPLNSIIGYSELLMEENSLSLNNPSQRNDRLQKINHSGVHLLHLINEILDLSKIEKNEFEVRKERINIKETVESAIDIIEPIANRKSVQVFYEPPIEQGWDVVADSLYLRQVFVNLLTNALKYSKPHGEVFIDHEIQEASMKINIKDNGIGIKDEYIPHIFDSFYRAPDQEVSGTGIGLSIVKSLVDKMEGSYGVQSKENEGSLFWVSLPIKNTEKEMSKV